MCTESRFYSPAYRFRYVLKLESASAPAAVSRYDVAIVVLGYNVNLYPLVFGHAQQFHSIAAIFQMVEYKSPRFLPTLN
jgi:hypothetical protein